MSTPHAPLTLDELTRDPARAAEIPPEAARDLLVRLAPLVEHLRLRALAGTVAAQGPLAIPTETDRLLTPDEAAERLNMPVSRVRELCRLRRLPAFKAGRTWRLSATALRAWVTQQLDTHGVSAIQSDHDPTASRPSPAAPQIRAIEIRHRPRVTGSS